MPEKEDTFENIEKLLLQMPEEARQMFARIMMREGTQESLKIIKSWIDVFNPNCPVDALISHLIQQVISRVGFSISEDLKRSKNAGDLCYTNKEAAHIAISELKKITEKLEKSVENPGYFQEVKH